MLLFSPQRIFFAILASCWACNIDSARADIQINGYTDATNDRFSNDPSFIVAGFNLSGVGQTETREWATAISRNVIISAAHLAPVGKVYFFPGNDPTATPVIRNIASGTKISQTDLYLAVLDDPLPASITHYQVASESLVGTPGALASAGVYQGVNAYMFGLSPKSYPVFYTEQAVGRNRINGYLENIPFAGNTDNDMLVLRYDSVGDPDYVQYESHIVGGDSGAPLFADVGGTLRVLGVNSAQLSSGGAFYGSGITYTGNRFSDIDNFIRAAAVPEPASIALLATVAGTAAIMRRKRNRSRKATLLVTGLKRKE